MKKAFAMIVCLWILFGIYGCGVNPPSETGKVSVDETGTAQINEHGTVYADESETTPGETRKDTAESSPADTESKILIAYFTWAENTVVEDESRIDEDATTSASVLVPGNAARIAGWIQERTGGDLFSIVVTEPYSSDYDECLNRAADEKAANDRPELAYHVENMEQYDVVFLGFPNWWYTVPMAVHSFLEEYDFSGKTVIPFVTHGTGGMAGTIEDMTASLPDSAVVLESIGISRSEVEGAQETVNGWLDGLGFTKTAADSAQTGEKTIVMTVNGQDIEVLLYDTPAANSLYEMLPLELTFEDYNGVEKISCLPKPLTTDGEPDSFDPDIGDFCLYAPWGNLSIFYQDFQNSSGLISLGKIEEGMDVISAMEDDFVVTLTKTED